jgi:hypothetical protein
MSKSCSSIILVYVVSFLLGSPAFAEQNNLTCPPPPNLQTSTTSVETKTAVNAVGKLLGKLGIGVNVRTTRDNILKDNPHADQVVTVLSMANMLCNFISSDTTLSGADKAARFQAMMLEILIRTQGGPPPVASTNVQPQGKRDQQNGLILLASADISSLHLAENELNYEIPTPRTGLLRDPPFYVTDANKYFVIVGSARNREAGIALMNKLKKKAPQYDFGLYGPYGNNPYYSVMMATWVPWDVAVKAREHARRDVAHDAYIWACRSSGESC